MKAKGTYLNFFCLFAAILSLNSLSDSKVLMLRGTVTSALTPLWLGTTYIKDKLNEPFSSDSLQNKKEELARKNMELENRSLREENERLKELIRHEYLIESELVQGQRLSNLFFDGNTFFERRYDDFMQLAALQMQAVPGRVIYRDPGSWSSSLWLNVGSLTNEQLGRVVVAKNSPVTLGLSLVGVVDYVGKNHCRVRLITDSGLTPSVRASRGYLQDHLLKQLVDKLIDSLDTRTDLFVNLRDNEVLAQNLRILRQNLDASQKGVQLAKGELRGFSQPLWRSKGTVLQGVGFNYDFADDEGPQRDLRTGRPLNSSLGDSEPLLKIDDLLVTTGMDGVFPPGLHVAQVISVQPLKEGSYCYELQAKPTVEDMNLLEHLFILPPLYFDHVQE